MYLCLPLTKQIIMLTFAAIDFETANKQRSSVCSVGIVWVNDGEITDSFYSLIHPVPNYYSYWCTAVHGLSKSDTEDSVTFDQIWPILEPRLQNIPLIAHNSPFDESCLRSVHQTFGWKYPGYPFYCTYRLSRRLYPQLPNHQLHTVSQFCGYKLDRHHHALADAEACAHIMRHMLDENEADSPQSLYQKFIHLK